MIFCAFPHPEFWHGISCALSWHHESNYHHSLTGPDEHWQSMALILHPDVAERDPYGVITQNQIHEYARMAESFVAGWKIYAVLINKRLDPPPYHILRDFIHGIADVPWDVAAQVALHYCKPWLGWGAYCADDRTPFQARV